MENISLNTETINYYVAEKAGVRDWILNDFYDLSVYETYLCERLTGIIIHHTEEYIFALEFFYDNISTGLFKWNAADRNKEKIVVATNTTHIQLEEGEYVESVKGSFTVDYVTQIVFCLNSGMIKGFTNEKVKIQTDVKYFMFKKENHQVFSFKMAFGKYLTFISPIFREIKGLYNILENNNDAKLFSSNKLGASFQDSIHFKYENELKTNGKIKQITLYHDNSLVKGIVVCYENKKVKHCYNITDENIKCETLKLDLTKGEEINKILIRSGDMIDNVTIYTNIGKSISSGGHGGGPSVFDINEMRKKLHNDKVQFGGFSGGYFNNMHNLQLIFCCLD